jgi:CRP/FNR family transcriptional regulator, cyclic AMP receptor protein
VKPDDVQVLATDPWFARLSPARRQALASRLVVRDAADLDRVYRVGDAPNGLWVVLAGEVRLVSYPIEGAEMLGLILRAGRWFGELSVLDGGPRPHDAVVNGPSRLAYASMAAVLALTETDPGFWRDLAQLTCAHQRRALAHIARRQTPGARARLAALLGDAADRAEPGRPIRINQTELAVIVGVSRQRLNRLLAGFAAEGLVRTAYGAVAVLEPERLRTLASADRADVLSAGWPASARPDLPSRRRP